MSYLDVPRIHFAGTFTADPSTINNSPGNYHATGNTPPRRLSPSWNPYGSAAWTVDAAVTSTVDSSGHRHDSGGLVGATIKSVPGPSGVPAKLVDLDVNQQARTQLFGLYLQLTLPDRETPLFTGYFGDGAKLLNLWPGRVPNAQDDNRFGAAFQSVLSLREVASVESDPVAGALLAAGAHLSIRLSVYGYDDNNFSPTFTQGRVVGTLGPQAQGEPRHMAGARFLNPTQTSQMYFTPAKLDEDRGTLTFDLGNSVPDQAGGGPPIDIGKMEAAILGSAPEIVGEIDYSEARYLETAGLAQLDLTAAQVAKAATNPVAIVTTPDAPVLDSDGEVRGTTIVSLAESADGVYVEVDEFSVRLEPGESRDIPIYARRFGQPLPGFEADLRLMRPASPADGVSFPASVTTGADGKAEFTVTGGHFSAADKPQSRLNIEGQVYLIGSSWAPGADQVAGAPLTALVFQETAPVAHPTWADVQPILYQYYVLYGYMAGIVNLSNYSVVKANADRIRSVLELPISDPLHMPVSRDLSAARRQIILDWIAQGCPAAPAGTAGPQARAVTHKAGREAREG